MPAILLIQAVDNPPCADDRLRYLAGDVLAVKYVDEPIGDAERDNPNIRIVKVDAEPEGLRPLLQDPTIGDGQSVALRRRAQKLDLGSLDRANAAVSKSDAKYGPLQEIAAAELAKHEAAAEVVDAGKRPAFGGRSTRGPR